MKIIIIGAGKVGKSIIEAINDKQHEITIIDRNYDALNKIRDKHDIICIQGDGTSADILKEANIVECDIAIAVTSSDEINLLACLIAKKLGSKNTIARIRNPQYEKDAYLFIEDMGLSMYVNPELETALDIARLIRFPYANRIETFCRGKVEIIEARIEERSPLANFAIKDIMKRFNVNILICALVRDGNVIIPNGDTVLLERDKIYLIGASTEIDRFIRRVIHVKQEIKNTMIIGGGKIAYYLAKELEKSKINVKIVEINKSRAEELSVSLPNSMIIHGDGTDFELLTEEGFFETDCLVTLTGIDEENVILSLNANNSNIKKSITKIDRFNSMEILDRLGIDSIVCPKEICANRVVSYVRSKKNAQGSNIEAMTRIVSGQVEAIEFVLKDTFKYFEIELMNLNFIPNLLIAAIYRNNRIIFPSGKTVLKENDHIIVVTTNKDLNDANDLIRE